ncbi:hypothetical protein EBQ93_03205 [bacterium]|nr:hypothetical protein [bacterium]
MKPIKILFSIILLSIRIIHTEDATQNTPTYLASSVAGSVLGGYIGYEIGTYWAMLPAYIAAFCSLPMEAKKQYLQKIKKLSKDEKTKLFSELETINKKIIEISNDPEFIENYNRKRAECMTDAVIEPQSIFEEDLVSYLTQSFFMYTLSAIADISNIKHAIEEQKNILKRAQNNDSELAELIVTTQRCLIAIEKEKLNTDNTEYEQFLHDCHIGDIELLALENGFHVYNGTVIISALIGAYTGYTIAKKLTQAL